MQRFPRFSKLLILAALLMPGLWLQSCENSNPTLPSQEPIIDLSSTPREDREAEEAALWLSGELLAPDSLYRSIIGDLAVIRAMYTFEAPMMNEVEFTPWWHSSRIHIKLTEAGWNKFQSGTFQALDSLNTLFRMIEMLPAGDDTSHAIRLAFKGRLHPWRLSEYYESLDGVAAACADTTDKDPSNIYPWRIGSGMTYLFRAVYRMCPGWYCYDSSDFWYFRSYRYIGGCWECNEWCNDPKPEWSEEAKAGYEYFINHIR